jgi:hypothetical protein
VNNLVSTEPHLLVSSLRLSEPFFEVLVGDLLVISSLGMREYRICSDIVYHILGQVDIPIVSEFQRTHVLDIDWGSGGKK